MPGAREKLVRGTSGPVRRGRGITPISVAEAAAGGVSGGSSVDHGITELTGDVTAGPGDGAQAATIGNGKVTLAKMADLATQRLIGRNTGSTGVPESVTATQVLDWIASTRGDLLMRGSASWGRLAPGTSGLALTSGGAAADLVYAKLLYAALQDVSATSKFLGRKSSGSGVIEELSVADALTMLGFVNAGGSLYTGSGHPQGSVSAPIGNIYLDLATGYKYNKVGGGSTAYGWYLERPLAGAGLGGPQGYLAMHSGIVASSSAMRLSGFGYFQSAVADSVEPFVANSVTTIANNYVSGKLYRKFTSAATSGTNMHHFSGGSGVTARQSLDDDFDVWIDFLTDSDITSNAIWFGFSNSNLTNSDTFATGGQGGLLIRYSTSASDGGWIGQSAKNGGANHSETATIASIAASTAYRLRVRFVRQGTPTVYFSVNDSTELSLTSNIPPTGQSYQLLFGLSTKANSARSYNVRSLGGWQGS